MEALRLRIQGSVVLSLVVTSEGLLRSTSPSVDRRMREDVEATLRRTPGARLDGGKHGTCRPAQNIVRRRPEDRNAERLAPVNAHHNQLGADLARDGQNLFGRTTVCHSDVRGPTAGEQRSGDLSDAGADPGLELAGVPVHIVRTREEQLVLTRIVDDMKERDGRGAVA